MSDFFSTVTKENITNNLNDNVNLFKKLYKKDGTFRTRYVSVNKRESFDCCLIFSDGMISAEVLNNAIIRPLHTYNEINTQQSLIDFIEKQVLYAAETVHSKSISEMVAALSYGDTVLLAQDSDEALIIDTKGWRTRGISEPENERVLQGPREGFDESVMLNVAMIKRRLCRTDLCCEYMTVGRRSDTKIFICYIDSIAKRSTVETIKSRIKNIDIDGVLDSNYINELINQNPSSVLKTIGTTEKPDVVAAKLLEGRIAIMVDGTPVVLTLPYFYNENFQSDDDYYQNYLISNLGRILRYVCFYVALTFPALYLALTVFHPNLLPASFFSSVATSRMGVPFSTLGECLILILIFEVLKETGVRMQQSVGHALSIVGGLVVGQAAVEARIISAPVLIVIALSGISGLMVPKLKSAVFYFKILLLILSSLLGLFGFFIGLTLFHIHLYRLNSLDCFYAQNSYFFTKNNLKDSIVRVPWSKMLKRPVSLTKNLNRLDMRKKP